jgi:zinc protease
MRFQSRFALLAAASLLPLGLAPTLAAAAPVKAPAKAAAPAVGKSVPVRSLVSQVSIPHTMFKLANGLTVIVHEDHKAPVVAVSVWYNVGSKDEPA